MCTLCEGSYNVQRYCDCDSTANDMHGIYPNGLEGTPDKEACSIATRKTVKVGNPDQFTYFLYQRGRSSMHTNENASLIFG